MDEDELKRAVGPHNLEKETVPVMAWSMMQVGGGKVSIKLMPAEEDKGFGLGLLAFVNTTRVETGASPSSESYWQATRKLLGVGPWPNKSQINNLKSKLGRYTGGFETYSSDNKKKKSWYASEERASAVRSIAHNAILLPCNTMQYHAMPCNSINSQHSSH